MKMLKCSLTAVLSVSSLAVAAADQSLQWPAVATVDIPQSTGKFDFLRVDAKRNRLLAAHENDETADYIDLAKHTLVSRVKVGGAVDHAMDTESKFYYVSVQEAKRVAVVDAATLKEVNSVKVAGPTDAIIFEPKNHRVYVTHDEGADVWVIDPATAKVVGTVQIPGVPEFMVYDPKADKIYLNIKNKDVVAVIDPASNKVVASWPTAPATHPHGLALDADKHQVYASGDNGKLVAIDTQSGAVTGSVDIASKVDQIAFDEAMGLIYSAGPDKMSVTRTTGAKLEALGYLSTSPTAKNVAVDPATHAVWTTYTDGKNSFAKGWSPPARP
ncbi:MAG: YncE family protein [Pseudomonadota bacterium]|nr:YncE family protein [Pseudomonadota bacterium]